MAATDMWGTCANALAAIGIVALVSDQGAAADDSFRLFQAVYRCDVVERLKLINATGNPANPLNRYLVINASAGDYVQCIFHDGTSRVLCEASSGVWATKRGHERTAYRTPRTIAALARLGFDTDDSTGNFRIRRSVGAPADFAPLADRMLRALHDRYGARSDTTLRFEAPFAQHRPAVCIPTS